MNTFQQIRCFANILRASTPGLPRELIGQTFSIRYEAVAPLVVGLLGLFSMISDISDAEYTQALEAASTASANTTSLQRSNDNDTASVLNTRDMLAPAAKTRAARFSFGKPPKVYPNTDSDSNSPAKLHFDSFFAKPVADQKVEPTFASKLTSDDVLGIWRINKKLSLAGTADSKKTNAIQKEKFVIMLDPGHGGSDPGSVGHNGLQEKTLTLAIAKRAAKYLSELENIEVKLTRDADFGLSRKSRVHRVKQSKADMMVSLHLNHLPQTDINLVEAFYAAPHNIRESLEKQRTEQGKGMIKTRVVHQHDLGFTRGSRRLASMVQRSVFNEVKNNDPGTSDAGVKEDTLYILTRSFTPGVLVEISCLSNEAEADRLTDPVYIDKLAAALAKGIKDYLATPEAKRQYGTKV